MTIRLVSLLSMVFLFPVPASLYGQDEVRDLVVKVHAIGRNPDVLRPWTKLNPQHVYGSGVVIEGKRILTNAHVVRYAGQIYVQPNQSAEKFTARVVAIAPPIDLALLELEDESFFARRGALRMAGELPGVKDTVNVYGYPTGGTELSVTQGIVSRIEFTEYYYSALGLRIQVDAALNPGNSGGPAVSGGKLIGVVFSRIPSAQSIGYLIPVEEIRMFLDDVADGTYNGKPRLHDLLQTVENSALRAKVGLPDDKSGILVVAPHSDDEEYLLKQWDVITQIGDYPIDSEGKVAVRYDLRLSAQYLVQKLARDGKIGMTVFRKGQLLNLQMPVQSHYSFILPYLMNDEPRYFIYGPLVFSQATQDYLERLGSQWELTLTRRASPLMSRRYDQPLFGGEELVVVCAPMFPHRITKGYEDPNTSVVTEINGIRVKSLRHLVEILRDVRGPQVVFKFVKKANWSQDVLVLNRSDALAATEDVLRENGIRYQYSNDIRPVWENSRLP